MLQMPKHWEKSVPIKCFTRSVLKQKYIFAELCKVIREGKQNCALQKKILTHVGTLKQISRYYKNKALIFLLFSFFEASPSQENKK